MGSLKKAAPTINVVDIVLRRHPHAESYFNLPLLPDDPEADVGGHWVVCAGPGFHSLVLGIGPSERDAWRAAAATVQGCLPPCDMTRFGKAAARGRGEAE